MRVLLPPTPRRERLQRSAHDVVVRLLPGERTARGLRVSAQLPTALVLGAETVAHRFRPDFAGRAVLGDLFEEIAMRVEKEAEPRCETVDRQASFERPIDVLDTVAQGERKFLDRGRAGLANMITADRNRIEARNTLRAVFD